jgi:hypothetical protein
MFIYSHFIFVYGYSDWGFSVLFPQLQSKCQGKSRKDGTRPSRFLVVVLFYVFVVLFYVFLCCSMYSLFCDVPCVIYVYMRTEQLPPGGYSIAVKYISYHIFSRGPVSNSKPKLTFYLLENTTTMKRCCFIFGMMMFYSPPTVPTSIFPSSLLWYK